MQPVAPVDVLPAVGPELAVVGPDPVVGRAGHRHIAAPEPPGRVGGREVCRGSGGMVGRDAVGARVRSVREGVAAQPDHPNGFGGFGMPCDMPRDEARPDLEVVIAADEHLAVRDRETSAEGSGPPLVLRENDNLRRTAELAESAPDDEFGPVDVTVDDDDDLELGVVLGGQRGEQHRQPERAGIGGHDDAGQAHRVGWVDRRAHGTHLPRRLTTCLWTRRIWTKWWIGDPGLPLEHTRSPTCGVPRRSAMSWPVGRRVR